MQQLAGQDASFIYVENELIKSHFTVLTVYDQSALDAPLRYRDILAYFEERLSGLAMFRRKLYRVPFELDAPWFADDPNFHIESHVRHIALPKPGDWRQFCILASQIQAVPIDMSRPLWDMHIIEGLDSVEGVPPGSFAILTRLHHAIADGTTARGILMALHHPAGKAPLPARRAPAERRPTYAEMLLRGLGNNLEQVAGVPLRLARILPDAGATLGRTAVDAAGRVLAGADPLDSLGRTRVPMSAFNRPMEYRRVFQLRRYPLAEIKRMRALAENATLNDVVLTLIGGGLERYLAAAREECGQDLVALCPINLREDKFSSASQLGNNISLMQVNLQTRTADPAERMRKVVENSTRAKLEQKATAAKELITLSKKAPNLLLALGTRLAMNTAFRERGVRLSNCIITNVPGPQEPLYFMGARLELFTGIAPITPNSGLTIPVTSYRGELCVAPSGCPGWVTDPQLLAECLDESYRELAAAAAEAHATAGAASRARPARKAGGSRPARKARSSTSVRKTPGARSTRRLRAQGTAASRRR